MTFELSRSLTADQLYERPAAWKACIISGPSSDEGTPLPSLVLHYLTATQMLTSSTLTAINFKVVKLLPELSDEDSGPDGLSFSDAGMVVLFAGQTPARKARTVMA